LREVRLQCIILHLFLAAYYLVSTQMMTASAKPRAPVSHRMTCRTTRHSHLRSRADRGVLLRRRAVILHEASPIRFTPKAPCLIDSQSFEIEDWLIVGSSSIRDRGILYNMYLQILGAISGRRYGHFPGSAYVDLTRARRRYDAQVYPRFRLTCRNQCRRRHGSV
jgi:hypothetical protein